jgi:hypothetical protein
MLSASLGQMALAVILGFDFTCLSIVRKKLIY